MPETTAPTTRGTAAASAGPATGTTSGSASPSTAGGRGRRAELALRTLQIVLALFYGAASALPKLIAHSSAVESFDRIGWGGTGMYVIGALELAGAVALLIPSLAALAATALGGLMVGAFLVQLTVFDGRNAATPLILMVPLALIAWTRRERIPELVARTHGRA
jgi:uncharacterized membrane protein